VQNGTTGIVSHFVAEVVTAQDYYSFGLTMPGRKYTAPSSSYRYGFNGQENDKDINIGAVAFEARVYDSRLVRFLSVDPLSNHQPYSSPYTFADNSPIYLIDENGEVPEPFLRSWFKNYASTNLGLTTNKQVGDLFERLVITSIQKGDPTVIHNTSLNFPSPERAKLNLGQNPLDVRPDGFSGKLGAETSRGKMPVRFFGAPSFYEAKITGSTLTKKYRKHQLAGMVDALSIAKDKMKAKYGILFLIVTQDTKISDDLLKYAADRGVIVKAAVLTYDSETKEFGVSDAQMMNAGYLYPGQGKNKTVQEAFPMGEEADVDKYEKIKVNEATKSSSNAADPDPPTCEDQ
jgi:RHS repeat-associated protein